MAMVRKTMAQIKEEMTPEKRLQISEKLKDHKPVYDPECPPQTMEQLAQFRPAVQHLSIG